MSVQPWQIRGTVENMRYRRRLRKFDRRAKRLGLTSWQLFYLDLIRTERDKRGL